MPWSDDVRVAFHPFRAYAELARDRGERPALIAATRAIFLLFILGAFVSITAAGRLVAFHVASTMLFWSFLPAIQAAWVAVAVHVVAPPGGPSKAEAIALYFAGHAPWMLLLTTLSGICLFAPDIYRTMNWLLMHGILPGSLLVTWIWSGVLTFACFRAGLGLDRRRAAAATVLFYFGFVSSILGYYLATNQIQPQLPWAR